MRYCSTRGGVVNQTFQQALFTGYASDGGILVPESVPSVTIETLKEWQGLKFADLAKQIVRLYIAEDEIPTRDLNDLIDRAFSTFSCPEVAPIKSLKDGLNIMELFHGKTWAFKDVALSCVGQLYNYFCARSRTHHTIIVGTSGDTGSAAIEAVRGLEWVDIIVLLPKGRCSLIQERQMTTVLEDNVHVFRVDGTSDDIDVCIKPCFLDSDLRQTYKLSSINSINWARIMVQIVHYFYAYLQMCPGCEEEVEVIIPTGACGNVTSGCFANRMGLPIRMVCAVTCNDIVYRTLTSGDFSVTPTVTPTLAPAMDIQIPYNMERLWYIFSNKDTALVADLMTKFEANNAIHVPDNIADKIREVIVDSYVSSDEELKQTMKQVWEDNSYLVCPHTAIAVAYHFSTREKTQKKRVCIATASVLKFREAVLEAGLVPPEDERVTGLVNMPTRYNDMEKGDNWGDILRGKIIDVGKKYVS